MPELPVIRPEPTVWDDYNGEKFETSVETTQNTTLKKMTSGQQSLLYITERVLYPEEGILMKYKGVPYLRQGFVFPEAMNGVNNLKKVSTLFLAVLKGKGIKGRINTFLWHYCWTANWMFQWYDPNSQKIRNLYLKENRYRRSVRELIKLINNFLANLGLGAWIKTLDENIGWVDNKLDFGRVIGTMLEYDNAYHWRMEDIFSEISLEKLSKNPRKELLRILLIYQSREKSHIEFKAEMIVKVLRYALLLPNVKKAFRKAIKSIDIERMKMQKDDSYFTMNYGGYDFQGKTLEERKKIWLEMTDGIIPPRVTIPIQ